MHFYAPIFTKRRFFCGVVAVNVPVVALLYAVCLHRIQQFPALCGIVRRRVMQEHDGCAAEGFCGV